MVFSCEGSNNDDILKLHIKALGCMTIRQGKQEQGGLVFIYPYLTNGFSHHYHLGQSTFIMPPTLKKLEGHIAFGLSVCLSVCVCVCVCASVNF